MSLITVRRCTEVSPQCPEGQEEAYKLGWYQGQIDMYDRHDGTPCQVISMQQEIDSLQNKLHQVRGDVEDVMIAVSMGWEASDDVLERIKVFVQDVPG